MSVSRVSMLIVVATIGITNISDNLVEMGLAAILDFIHHHRGVEKLRVAGEEDHDDSDIPPTTDRG